MSAWPLWAQIALGVALGLVALEVLCALILTALEDV